MRATVFFLHTAKGAAMVALVRQADASGERYGHTALFDALGKQFLRHPPPKAQRMAILNDVWRVVGKHAASFASSASTDADSTDSAATDSADQGKQKAAAAGAATAAKQNYLRLNAYVSCAATWVDVLLSHFGDREVVALLSDVNAKVETFKQATRLPPSSPSSSSVAALELALLPGGGSGGGGGGGAFGPVAALEKASPLLERRRQRQQ